MREARETFSHEGRERAIAPDSMVILIQPNGDKLGAFIELDRGTMSHARLRAKAELYAAYAASDAWHGRHLYLPPLLFITTTPARGRRFLKALASALSLGPRRDRRWFIAGASPLAWTPYRLLDDPCFDDLDGHTGLTLLEVLAAARAPHDHALAQERQQREGEERQLEILRADPPAMREHLRAHQGALTSYIALLGPHGEQALALLLASEAQPTPYEAGVLKAIARDLDTELLNPWAYDLPAPHAAVKAEVELLIEDYRHQQLHQVDALASHHDRIPPLRQPLERLRRGDLLDPPTIRRLPQEVERYLAGRREQLRERDTYRQGRETVALQQARQAGLLGRLTHRPEEFYPPIDRANLRTCRACQQTVYPRQDRSHRCHYCKATQTLSPYQPDESEAPP